MKFTRNITKKELTVIGDHPVRFINAVIDTALHELANGKNASARILSLMSSRTTMNARQIKEAHNAVYGTTPVTVDYTRFVLSKMHKMGIITRKSRGRYLR